jgi:hypothetical protein
MTTKSDKLKVFLFPGWVHSADGDDHWISAANLARLYGVRQDDDVIVYNSKHPMHRHPKRYFPEHIRLYPLSNGKYYNIHVEYKNDDR